MNMSSEFRSYGLLAGCHGHYVRGVKQAQYGKSRFRKTLVTTGVDCYAYVGGIKSNYQNTSYVPEFHVSFEGVNYSKSMFPELAPVFKVEGWNIDGTISMDTALFFYAESVNDGKPQFMNSKEEEGEEKERRAQIVKERFFSIRKDIPEDAFELLKNSCEKDNKIVEFLESIRKDVYDEFGSVPMIVKRNNEKLASILGIPLEEARAIPSGLSHEEFKFEIIEPLMPARRALVQKAWDCLTDFKPAYLPNDYEDLYSFREKFELYPYPIKKKVALYQSAMVIPKTHHWDYPEMKEMSREEEEAYLIPLGFKVPDYAFLDGIIFYNNNKGHEIEVQLSDHLEKVVKSLNCGTFEKDFREKCEAVIMKM